jgi:hypothetical protein
MAGTQPRTRSCNEYFTWSNIFHSCAVERRESRNSNEPDHEFCLVSGGESRTDIPGRRPKTLKAVGPVARHHRAVGDVALGERHREHR